MYIYIYIYTHFKKIKPIYFHGNYNWCKKQSYVVGWSEFLLLNSFSTVITFGYTLLAAMN